jgi:plasmid maintenance system antidote protein VapI
MGEAYITMADLRDRLWDLVNRLHSQQAVAKHLHISESYLSEILDGKPISEQVAHKMGYTMSRMYAPKDEQ